MSLQAVILAAGQGKRLLPLTQEIPKALLPLNGSTGLTILERQFAHLKDMGMKETLVVGHGRGRVVQLLGGRVNYVLNREYESINSIYSFFLTRRRDYEGSP